MNLHNLTILTILLPVLIMATAACAPYLYSLYVPATGYNIAQSLTEENNPETGLERFNFELASNNAPVTIADTYQAAYGKNLEDLPQDGDTGQAFTDMRTATRYLSNILQAKGITDAENYVLTRLEGKEREGFELIAVVYRPNRVITVRDQANPGIPKVLSPEAPEYYKPYRTNGNGGMQDAVVEWAAVPVDCFEKQGQQAVVLTAAANHVISREPVSDFWQATQKWENGDIASVIVAQDYLACQSIVVASG